MLCGNCPRLNAEHMPADWQPRAQCCMDEAHEIEARGEKTFADVVDTSLPPFRNRRERRRHAAQARRR